MSGNNNCDYCDNINNRIAVLRNAIEWRNARYDELYGRLAEIEGDIMGNNCIPIADYDEWSQLHSELYQISMEMEEIEDELREIERPRPRRNNN